MKTIVSEKGQITIPKGLRDRMGLVPGTVLEVDAIEGKLVAVKREQTDVFAKWRGRGTIPGDLSVDEYIKKARE
jgi:AbrB family looped-hinge helix DNA binding protein